MSADEELQRLTELVAKLTADNQRLQQQNPLPVTQPEAANGQSTSSAPVAERLIYIPRDRKCPNFRGRTGLKITEWVEEVQACMRARHLSTGDQALFIYDHLEGEAKDEIRYRPRADRESPDRILAILQELYGCSQSYIALQENFFSRKQQEGESLQEFSHALMHLMEKVVRSAPNSMTNSEVLLRDQFVEYVHDCALRRELKQLVRRHPTYTLLEVRGEAIRWEREGMPGGGRNRSHSVPALGTQYGVQGTSPNLASAEWAELKAMMQRQQAQLDQLTQTVTQLQNPPRRPQPTRRGPVVCWRCHQPGHTSRDCGSPPAPPPGPAVLPSSSQTQANTSQAPGEMSKN